MSRIVPVLLMVLAGCAGTEPPEIVLFEVDPTVVEAGGEVSSTVEVAHFTLTGEEGHTDGGEAHGGDDDGTGHVHIYMDDTGGNPLLMQVVTTATVAIPSDTPVGTHTLIARLHDAGHLIIEPQVIAELEIEVLEATGMSGTTR